MKFADNLWAYQAVEPQHLHRTTHRVALHSTPIAEDWAKRASNRATRDRARGSGR